MATAVPATTTDIGRDVQPRSRSALFELNNCASPLPGGHVVPRWSDQRCFLVVGNGPRTCPPFSLAAGSCALVHSRTVRLSARLPHAQGGILDGVALLNEALEGRYRIIRELGEGGMARVHLADDLRHERKVALKVLKPELVAVVGAERFLAEIKTTASLSHPHTFRFSIRERRTVPCSTSCPSWRANRSGTDWTGSPSYRWPRPSASRQTWRRSSPRRTVRASRQHPSACGPGVGRGLRDRARRERRKRETADGDRTQSRHPTLQESDS